MGKLAEYRFELFADYFQIVLMADGVEVPDWSDCFTDQSVADRLVVVPYAVVVQPERNMTVPVTVEVRDDPPGDNFSGWDHVSEASIDAPTGRLIMTELHTWDTEPERRIAVAPGTYRVRTYHAGLNTLSTNGLDGDDYYRLVLWPAEYREPRVLKRFERH